MLICVKLSLVEISHSILVSFHSYLSLSQGRLQSVTNQTIFLSAKASTILNVTKEGSPKCTVKISFRLCELPSTLVTHHSETRLIPSNASLGVTVTIITVL